MRWLRLFSHAPSELLSYQWDEVRLYAQGSQAGRLIEAAHDVPADNDEIIREMAGNDAGEILARVRELVCS